MPAPAPPILYNCINNRCLLYVSYNACAFLPYVVCMVVCAACRPICYCIRCIVCHTLLYPLRSYYCACVKRHAAIVGYLEHVWHVAHVVYVVIYLYVSAWFP